MATVYTEAQYLPLAMAQADTLSGAARTNAITSIQAVSPWASLDVRLTATAATSPSLPYFILLPGDYPYLYTPPAAPPPAPWQNRSTATEFDNAAQAATYPTGGTIPERMSFQAIDLFQPSSTRDAYAATTDLSGTYFALFPGNDPRLVNIVPPAPPGPPPPPPPAPPGPPPPPGVPAITIPATTPITVAFGQPCPPGYTSTGVPALHPMSIAAQVDSALASLGPVAVSTGPGAGVCPIVSGVAEYVSPDDWLAILIYTTNLTSGLQLSLRIQTESGALNYQTASLDGVAASTLTRLVFPLTQGCLLGVVVSDWGGNIQPGTCFVAIALQRSSGLTVPPHTLLAQGFVTALVSVSYPAGGVGGVSLTGSVSSPFGGTGVPQYLQSRAGLSELTPTVAVTLPMTVQQGSTLVAFTQSQYHINTHTLTDNQGNSYTQVVTTGPNRAWVAANAKSGGTTATYNASGAGTDYPLQLHLYEISGLDLGSPVDVSAEVDNTSYTIATASTSHTNVAIGAFSLLSPSPNTYTLTPGWTVYQDSTDNVPYRFVSFVDMVLSQPTAARSYTVTATASGVFLLLLALHVAGG